MAIGYFVTKLYKKWYYILQCSLSNSTPCDRSWIKMLLFLCMKQTYLSVFMQTNSYLYHTEVLVLNMQWIQDESYCACCVYVMRTLAVNTLYCQNDVLVNKHNVRFANTPLKSKIKVNDPRSLKVTPNML